jgi:hypothetical protein
MNGERARHIEDAADDIHNKSVAPYLVIGTVRANHEDRISQLLRMQSSHHIINPPCIVGKTRRFAGDKSLIWDN